MNTLATLAPMVQMELNRCSSTLAQYALRRAAREFLRKTGIWQETITMDVVADQSEYTLASAVASATIYRIVSVNTNGGEGDNLPAEQYEFTDNTTLTLDDAYTPTDAETDGLVVVVSLIPPLVGTDFTVSAILDRWAEAIIAKAISDLAMVPKRPYTDFAVAALKKAEYDRHLKQCLADVHLHGYKTGQAFRLGPIRQFSKHN